MGRCRHARSILLSLSSAPGHPGCFQLSASGNNGVANIGVQRREQELAEFRGGEVDRPTVVVGEFNGPLSVIGRVVRWTPCISPMKNTVDSLGPTDTDRTLSPTIAAP